ncbi:LamG-like jellyroll fold domain-containing protein [Lyngbya aestuarii]|uniref:LamG-like jellyroll fold domain-containing protein n=1 Tax=Lyngbya aestuarii TaxID=118322 RepID=UPI00403E1BE1
MGYATIAFAILIALQNNTHLTNWDSTFPLSMGNESTGDRPWHGYISEVWISNRAISDKEVTQSFSRNYPTVAIEDSLVVFYQLIGQGSYADQAGHLPDLFWQGKLLDNQNRADVLLTPSHWLKTLTPATYLTQKICQASQFTLSTTVATANTTQSGLARIISLSGDPYHRNFTLGQEETNLVFRLRTPLTGENGTTPELIVPNVFADTNPHQLIITYDGSSLRLYIDQLKKLYSINLNSGLTLFQFLSPLDNDWSIQLNTFNPKISTMLCYALIFIPLGFILALITTIMRGKFIFYIFLICGGVVLPGLILEAMLAIENHRNMGLENTLTSIVITLVALLLFRVPFKTHLNFRQQL